MTYEAVFFFQAEDGIRDKLVTGVQTCALPIYLGNPFLPTSPTGGFSPLMSLAQFNCVPLMEGARLSASSTVRQSSPCHQRSCFHPLKQEIAMKGDTLVRTFFTNRSVGPESLVNGATCAGTNPFCEPKHIRRQSTWIRQRAAMNT